MVGRLEPGAGAAAPTAGISRRRSTRRRGPLRRNADAAGGPAGLGVRGRGGAGRTGGGVRAHMCEDVVGAPGRGAAATATTRAPSAARGPRAAGDGAEPTHATPPARAPLSLPPTSS